MKVLSPDGSWILLVNTITTVADRIHPPYSGKEIFPMHAEGILVLLPKST